MSPIANEVTLPLLALAGLAVFLLFNQRRSFQVPKRVTVVPVSDEALMPGQQAAMAALDPQLAALGYRPVGNGHFGHTGPTQVLRLYGHPDDPAVVMAFLFEAEAPLKPISSIEFMTARTDGSEVATGNTTVSALFAARPGDRIQRCPGLAPAALKQRHDAACQEPGPPPIRLDGFEAIMRFGADYQARYMDHQVAVGLMRFDAATDTYRGTFRMAFRQLREAIRLQPGLRPGLLLLILATVLLPSVLGLSLQPARAHLPAIGGDLVMQSALCAVAGGVCGYGFGYSTGLLASALLMAVISGLWLPWALFIGIWLLVSRWRWGPGLTKAAPAPDNP